jgi:putative transposase
MGQNYFSIWIHLVWSTKNRQPLIYLKLKQPLYNKMREIADEKDFRLDFINGMYDHIHLLVSIQPKQSISQIVQYLKGISSTWINKNGLCEEYFEWQDGFSAFSVSPTQLYAVREYIKNQEKHHANIGVDEEIEKIKSLIN